jgi:hypothetical protein
MLENKFLHSTNNFSSHSHNWQRHVHADPSASHPKSLISTTVLDRKRDKSKRRRYLTLRGTPPNHESVQKNVSTPLPTRRSTLSSDHRLSASTLTLYNYSYGNKILIYIIFQLNLRNQIFLKFF